MELVLSALLGIIIGIITLYASSPIDREEYPCNLDHNGECTVCDCWLVDCAYERYLNEDYTYETKEQLEKMFKNTKQC